MPRIYVLFILNLIASTQAVMALESPVGPRQVLDFNTQWGFRLGDVTEADKEDYNDTGWAAVTVPHTIRLERKHCGGDVYQGFAWYRRHFTADPAWKGRQVNIDFEGIQTESWISLNGIPVGHRAGGYMGFSIDVTDRLRFDGPNVIAIRVSNLDDSDIPPGKPCRQLDFNYFGGLYRNVRLRIQDPLRITDALQADRVAGGGVFVTYPTVSTDAAVVRVKTHVANQRHRDETVVVRSILLDQAGRTVAQADSAAIVLAAGTDQHLTQDLAVPKPQLWHPDHPNLYRLISEIRVADAVIDRQGTRIGIRHLAFKPEGFFLNGEKLYLRGGNRHQQLPYIGDALPDALQRRDAELLRADGFNAVRAAHYPNAPAFLDACDELGVLVIDCQPGWQNFTKTEAFHDRTLRDAREMIRRDRNHPCVMLYETFLNETQHPPTWLKEVTDIAKAEYPGDQLFQVCDGSLPGYNVGYKVVYKKSSFVDQDPNRPFLTREWGDWTTLTRQLRSKGEMGMIMQVVSWQTYLNGEGYDDWGGLDACERIGGHFLWSWMDHTRGARSESAACGAVDANRYPKFGHYYLRSMTDAHNPAWGPMAFIADYNLPADPKHTATISAPLHHDRSQRWSVPWTSMSVLVLSNCDRVRLYQDGRLIEEKDRTANAMTAPAIANKGGSPYYVFTLPERHPGILRAEGLINGTVAATHEVRTPGKEARLAIEAAYRDSPLIADGSDLYPVYVRVVDEQGTLIPTATTSIMLRVEGAGRLVGAGIPRIGAENQRCEAGLGQAYIRSSGTPGHIIITAAAPGLTSGRMELTSIPSTHRFVPDASHGTWSEDPRLLEADSQVATPAQGPVGTAITDAQIESIRASSEAPGRGVSALRDGVEEFGSGWLAGTTAFPHTITVTFTNPLPVSAIQTLWEKDSTWYTYSVQASRDGKKQWDTVMRSSSVTGHTRDPQRLTPSPNNVKAIRIIIEDVQTGTGESVVGMAELRLFTR